jgi:predicted AAA+ superfamily ATPase
MQGMFTRLVADRLTALAPRFPAVIILGARQVGKTTLARHAFPDLPYLDCEDPTTAASLREDARFVLAGREKRGLIIDEAQAVGGVLPAVRGLIDEQRARNGRFVILGSAQPALVRGVAESLAGRAAVVELSPLTAGEARTGDSPVEWRTVWLKGGFPDALRGDFREWWEAYLRLVLERDMPQYGVPADAVFMRRLLTMLAHSQGGLLNASQLGASLGVSYHTIQRYVTLLEQTFLIRPLRPYFRNLGKRLVKAPKVYIRDTGLVHHLLNISSEEQLLSHPVRGASWETFVIEDVLRREQVQHPESRAFFWRTAAGAEIDLVIERGDQRVGIEIKSARGDQPRAVKSLEEALSDVDAQRGWIVDQTADIDRVSFRVARGGFSELIDGTP